MRAPPGCGNDDERLPGRKRAINGPSDGLSYDATHASTNEGEFHHTQYYGMRTKVAHGIDHRVVQASLAPGLLQPVAIRLYVDKFERIGGHQFQVNQLESGFEQAGYPASSVQP